MKNIDIFVLSFVLIIFVSYFCFIKNNKININNNIQEDFNSLYNYSKNEFDRRPWYRYVLVVMMKYMYIKLM